MDSMREGAAEPGPGTLLVVDDERYYRQALKRLLRHRGYDVRTADNGEAALQLAPGLRPDLILLDVKMFGIDGYATCQRLKADPATRDIPVIFISGAGDVAAKVQAFASGGVDYIAKPFHDEEVLARIATHLALLSLQRRLEEQVRQRSSVLAMANARLQREIADRRQAEERFRSVLEAAPDAMVLVNARRQMVFVNSRAEALFGYARDELLGQPVEKLMPERFRDVHANYGAAYVAAPRPRAMGDNLALFGRHRDGREFPVEVSLSPLQTTDGPYVISAIRDITGRRQAEATLRDLAAHRDAVREEERKRIAGDIHDELGSLLTALKMDISLLRMELGGNPAAGQRLAQMRELTEHTIRMVRQVATRLRPTALNLGLVAALEWLLEDFGQRTGIACRLDADAEANLDDAQTTAVFRIVQESLTNVARHAQAGEVEVSLQRSGEGLELTVADDGRGFDTRAVANGSFGLLGIRERALALGGRVAVLSAPGSGTRVNIWIPLAEGEG